MAKVKKSSRVFEDDPISTQINKKMDIIRSGSEVLDYLNDEKVISFSPALDLALGGGLKEGTCVTITGPGKVGKTTSLMHFLGKCQQLGKPTFYYSTENKIVKENLIDIKTLDYNKLKVIQPTPEKPQISAEEYLNTIEQHVQNTPGMVGVIDSLSDLTPQDELDGEISAKIRNQLPKLAALFFRRIKSPVRLNKAILIFVTHQIANTSGRSPYAPSTISDGGNSLKYSVVTNIVATHATRWKNSEGGNDIGQAINWKVITSAAGGIPNSEAVSWLRYGIGLDEAKEIADIATELSLIGGKSKSWLTINSFIGNNDPAIIEYLASQNVNPEDTDSVESAFKFNGINKIAQFLDENPKLCDLLYKQIKELHEI